MADADTALLLSHAILIIAALYCVGNSRSVDFQHAAYSIVLIHNIIAILVGFGFPLESICLITFAAQFMIPMPCISGKMWMDSGNNRFVAMLHPLAAFVPFVMFLTGQDYALLLDIVLGICVVTALYNSIVQKNWLGVVCTVLFCVAYSIIKTDEGLDKMLTSSIFNYVYAAFIVLSVHAVTASENSAEIIC